MKILSYTLLLIIVLLTLVFACLNAEPVMINYYLGSDRLPLSLLLAIAFALGGLLGLIVSTIAMVKLKASHLKLRSRLKVVEQELANLRTMPLQDHSQL